MQQFISITLKRFFMKKLLLLSAFIALHVCGLAQLPNADFENWGTATSGRPYLLMWPQMESAWHYRDTVAQHGSYALSVSVWYYYTKTEAVLETPVSSRPALLHGYYRYRLNRMRHNGIEEVEDTAAVKVWLCRWNNITGQRDTVGQGAQYLYGSPGYASFDCLIDYSSSAIPDTFIVSFDPSILIERSGYFCPFSDGYSSFLSIDNISFADVPADLKDLSSENFLLYPNPAAQSVEIKFPAPVSGTVCITDVAGKTLLHEMINGPRTSIDIAGLPAGAYIVTVQDSARTPLHAKMFIKQ